MAQEGLEEEVPQDDTQENVQKEEEKGEEPAEEKSQESNEEIILKKNTLKVKNDTMKYKLNSEDLKGAIDQFEDEASRNSLDLPEDNAQPEEEMKEEDVKEDPVEEGEKAEEPP